MVELPPRPPSRRPISLFGRPDVAGIIAGMDEITSPHDRFFKGMLTGPARTKFPLPPENTPLTGNSNRAIMLHGRGGSKPLHFMGSSKKDLRDMPEPVKDVFGSALLDAQYGDHPEGARPFGEGVPREVMKLVEDFYRNTYRAAYAVAFPRAVYVLHVFKKTSSSGIGTPRPDKETIRVRLQAAEEHYRRTYGQGT